MIRPLLTALALIIGAAWAAPAWIDIIPEPSQSERLGDGLGQFLTGEADGKFSGPSELRKLRKVLAVANWKEVDVEKLITRGRMTEVEAKAVLAVVKEKGTKESEWFVAELKNSPLAKACGY